MRSRALVLTGGLGSAIVALGGTGAGALPPSGWDLLSGRPPAAAAVFWLGVAVLAGSWWRLRGRDLGAQRAACLLWSAPLLCAPPLLSRDLHAYAAQGALVVAGRDPYAVGPGALPGPLTAGVDPVWLDAPAPYGPVWLELAGLAVRLAGGELVGTLLVLRGLAALGLALTAWALLRLARDPARALWLGTANPLVLLHLLAGGHNDALMVGLLAAGLAVARTTSGRRALAVAGVLVTLAGLVKVPALLGLAHLPLLAGVTHRDRLRAAAVVSGTTAVTVLAVPAATGLGWGWLGALDAGRARLSLSSPLTGLGTAVGALDAVLAAGLVAAGLLAVGLLVVAARPDGDPVRALGLTLLVGALLLPVVQPWYVLWGVVLLAAVTGPRAAAALGAVCLVLCLAVGPDGRHVVRPPLYGLSTVLALAAGALVLRRPPPDRLVSSLPPSAGAPPVTVPR